MSRSKCEEYPLPIHWKADPPADLVPWFRRFDGLGALAVHTLLREDWSGISTPAVASLCDAIANFTPNSLILPLGQTPGSIRLHRSPESRGIARPSESRGSAILR